MAALATVAELEDRLGRTLTGAPLDRAEAALDDASALVRDEGDEDWDSLTAPDRVVQIVLAAAYRAFTNPDALAQATSGDVSVSYGTVPGAVYLTAAELRAVRRHAGGSGMQSLTLVTPYTGGAGDSLIGE